MSKPKITIGMPVFNERRFVAASIESLLDQSFQDFQLIIADNCSTDGTMEICQSFAKSDARIQLVRHNENLGATGNFRYVLGRATGHYFMWAGSHDLWDENLLATLSGLLDRHPDAALAYGNTRVIDGHNQTTIELTPDQVSYDHPCAVQRATDLVRTLTWCNMVYGLFRTDSIRAVRLDVPCLGNDLVFLMETALRGKILHCDQTTFIRREYRTPPSDPNVGLLAQLKRIVGDSSNAEKHMRRRYTNWFYEHLKSAWRVPGGAPHRLARTTRVGYAFLQRWHPLVESRLLKSLYWLASRSVRRTKNTGHKINRAGQRIATFFAGPAG